MNAMRSLILGSFWVNRGDTSPIDQIWSRLGTEVLRISLVSKDRFLGFRANQARWDADTETMPFDLKNKRVVVTGGAGFMGRFVCEKVAQRGAAEVDCATKSGI